MNKRFLLSVAFLLAIGYAMGQGTILVPAPQAMYLSLPDQSIIYSVSSTGKPTFNNAAINAIIDQYNVTDFKKAIPGAREKYLKDVYQLNCSSAALGASLKASFPTLFPYYELIRPAQPLADYYPNEWTDSLSDIRQLDYIHAPVAWGITKGDPNVVIGVTDFYFDMTNPEFQNKVAQLRYNPPSTSDHGTMVAGLVACATDNNYGMAAIGFNCRMDLSSQTTDKEMLNMSNDGRKVLNASWQDGYPSMALDIDGHFIAQGIYNQIYQNGTFATFGAGNGYSSDAVNGPRSYCFPGSLNHNFTVTNVGWLNPRTPGSFNAIGVHETVIGDTGTGPSNNCYHHNSRVDLCAPSYQISSLYYNHNDPSQHFMWNTGWGTSFASPMVAGTAGLLLSENPCLSPYQIEYILKKSANTEFLNYPENLRYAGRIGSGGLDAGKAVKMADPKKLYPNITQILCNDPGTQTFIIEGIEVNTICKPGSSSNGVKPTFTPILKNGVPPYTYHWKAVPGNNTTLDNYDIATPTVMTSSGLNVAYYRLTVYDGSEVQKIADKIIRIQLKASGYDLAMRDNFMDMLDEPNNMSGLDPRDWWFFNSPDIWNRKTMDGGLVNEMPEYYISNPNYVYTKIRNVGCAASPADKKLKLYWTMASTTEKWSSDWDGTGGNYPGTTEPRGGEITPSGGITIPVLEPGESRVLPPTPWYVVNPKDYDPDNVRLSACLLARIEEAPGYPFGMTVPEISNFNILPNVINNNNIVTANTFIMDAVEGNSAPWNPILVGNADQVAGNYTLQLINDRAINLHYAGDMSALVTTRVRLSDELYSLWARSGFNGTYVSRDDDTKTVTFDGSTTMELRNLTFNPGERFKVKVQFQMRDGVVAEDAQFLVHFRQLNENNPKAPVYGNVSYIVNTHRSIGAMNRQISLSPAFESGTYKIYPNPTSDKIAIDCPGKEKQVSVQLYDITGRLLFKNDKVTLGAQSYELSLGKFIPGIYMVTITDESGVSERFKVIRK